MNPKFLLLIPSIILITHSFAQKVVYLTPPGAVYYSHPKFSNRIQTLASSKLFENPRDGFIVLKNGDSVTNLKLQYDCMNHQVLASLKNRSTNNLSVQGIMYVDTYPSILFNPENLGYKPASDKEKVDGLIELNYQSDQGDYMIGRYYYTSIQRPNYNPILGTGNKNTKVEINSKRYLFYNGIYYYLPYSRKKLYQELNKKLNITITKKFKAKNDSELIQILEINLDND